MNADVRRKFEMAGRVRAFVRAHPSDGPGFAAALARFEELVTRAQSHEAQQRDGRISARGATIRRAQLRHQLVFQLLRHLVGVGAVAAKERPELAQQFQLPAPNGSNLALLTAAKGMLAEAEGSRDFLVGQGMSETLPDDLRKAVEEFEKVNDISRDARRDHVGARADLEAVTREILTQVKLLDGMIRYRLGGDAELMAAWKSARNVPNRRAKVVPPAVAPETPTLGEGGVEKVA